jgi:pyrroline-5-carboxylate reductase
MMKLGFIGGGNMAEALLRGLLAKKLFKASELIVSDVVPERRRKLARALKIATTADNLEVLAKARALVLAVKPQQIDAVLNEIASAIAEGGATRAGEKRIAQKDRLFISIAAGITLSRLERALGPRARIVRVMPNAPAMVGRGMAAIVGASGASKADRAFALRLFRAVGDAVALEDEALLDVVTALSGSGPAYVYLFVKAMADAATSLGLPQELALRMALKTVEGAEYNMRISRLGPDELIRMVASPGGTTEAALKRFAAANFSDIVANAVKAAAERSRELGRSY